VELSDVKLPKEPPTEEGKGSNKRWLLGGPPYPVEAEDPEVFKKPTQREDQNRTPSGPTLLSDSDVKLIDPKETKPLDDGPTDPKPQKKKKKK
jgi:hypothetical protein